MSSTAVFPSTAGGGVSFTREEINACITQLCYFCGEDEFVDVHEIWGSDFQLDTCCYASHESWVDAMNCPVDGRDACEYIARLLDQYINTRQVFISSDEGIRIDFGLTVKKWERGCELGQKDVKNFINANHRHNAAPAGWKYAHLIYNGSDLIAVVWTGRPVSRHLDDGTTLEVNRLCIDHSLDRALTWKAASVGYKASATEAERMGYSRLITYTLESERGLSLRYARWKRDGAAGGGSWHRTSRPRVDKADTGRKVRWSKQLVVTDHLRLAADVCAPLGAHK